MPDGRMAMPDERMAMPDERMKTDEKMKEFHALFNNKFGDMKENFEQVMEAIHEFNEDFKGGLSGGGLKSDEKVLKRIEKLADDVDTYHKVHELGNMQINDKTMFFNAILVGDYIYSIYFPESVRQYLGQYIDVEKDDTEFGKVMKKVQEDVLEWYSEKYDTTIKNRQHVAETPAGIKVAFAPLLLSLVCLYSTKDNDFAINHYKLTRDKYFKSEREKIVGDNTHIRRAATAIAQGKRAMFSEIVRTLEEMEENNKLILNQISELETAFNSWYDSLGTGESDQKGHNLLEASIKLRSQYKITNLLTYHILFPLVPELCSLGRFTELVPLDRA